MGVACNKAKQRKTAEDDEVASSIIVFPGVTSVRDSLMKSLSVMVSAQGINHKPPRHGS